MQIDTVHHCNDSGSGEFALTLLAFFPADRASFRQRQRVYSQVGLIPRLTFGTHSAAGFVINRGTINWRDAVKTLLFTRSRPHHKNDNCLRHKCRVEQKTNLWFDGAVVRNYAGCARFDTPKEFAALADVYSPLCLLLNYFIPGKKLISKTSMGSKTIKRYDQPKTPFQRLVESPHLSQEVKERLVKKRALLNPVALQYAVHKAVNRLLAVHRAKVTFSK